MDRTEEEVLEERRKKQMFLKSEIIDAGFDGAHFAEFLNDQKDGGGSNIDAWDWEELTALVEKFIAIESG